MADVVLWLGGNSARGEMAASVAISRPGSVVVVSTEGDPRGCLQKLLDRGIAKERVILDYKAWDTVTNFSLTWPLIEKLGAKTVYVVTDGFHMRRSMGIAKIVYAGRGVKALAMPSSPSGAKEPWRLTIEDWLRAALWRLTGIQHKWQHVYDARWPQIQVDAAIAEQL